MKLTYLNTENNTLFTRYDDYENAIDIIVKEKIKEIHIQTNISGVASLFSADATHILEPEKKSFILDLRWLNGLNQLESVYIYPSVDIQIVGLSALYSLENLEHLEFQFFTNWASLTKEDLDLNRFKKLKSFTSVWNNKIIHLSSCISLEKLQIRLYPKLDCQEIRELIHLKYLQIMESKIKNLNGIENLQHLTSLIIGHCRQLENIDNISQCLYLESIHIEKCAKLFDINIESQSLRKITLDKVSNLKFLYDCPNVERLFFNDNRDGNMNPIIDNRIKEVYFYPAKRPHYQYSEKELHQILKQS